jgi:hypothetical protein
VLVTYPIHLPQHKLKLRPFYLVHGIVVTMHDAKGEQDQNTLDSQGRSSNRNLFWGANIKDLVSLCVVGKDEEDSNADKSDHLP